MLARIRAGARPEPKAPCGLPATWLAWLLPVFAWAPLAYPGYFEFLNGFSPVFNLDALGEALRSGELAWTPAIGQPYDLLRGDGWLPYLLAFVPRLVGFSGPVAVKLVLAAGILGGSLGMYFWTRQRFGPWPALLAAAVYTFWPLGLATIYVRGAFAEAALCGLLPWVWWAASAASRTGRWAAAGGLAAAMAAALWIQPGLAVWLAGCVLLYLLGSGLRAATHGAAVAGPVRAAGLRSLLGWCAGLALGSLAWLPAWRAHGGPGNASYVNFADHFVSPYQLLQPVQTAGPLDQMPLQLGLVACGLSVLALVLYFTGQATEIAGPDDAQAISADEALRKAEIILAVLLAVLPILLSLTLAAPLWRAMPALARTVTFPWQPLLLAGPWLAWLSGLAGVTLTAGLRRAAVGAPEATVPLFACLIALALLGVYGDLNPPSTPVSVPEQPLAVFGDNQIALVSATISGTVPSGNRVTVQTEWQALRPLDRDYTVFLHVFGPDGEQWGQQDTMPQDNKFPTSRWRPGAVIDDAYTVTLKPGAPAQGPYRYELGLYQYQTGQRLPTARDDKVTIKDAE